MFSATTTGPETEKMEPGRLSESAACRSLGAMVREVVEWTELTGGEEGGGLELEETVEEGERVGGSGGRSSAAAGGGGEDD
jgi:hypothetical protein